MTQFVPYAVVGLIVAAAVFYVWVEWSRLSRSRAGTSLRRFVGRYAESSKREFIADTANTLSSLYLLAGAVVVAWLRATNAQLSHRLQSPWFVWMFVAATAYTFVHRTWLAGTFQSKKRELAQTRRSQALSVAVGRLASAIRPGGADGFTAVLLDQVEHGLLEAILSETEAHIGPGGMYLNVNLLVEDPARPDSHLRCLNRARRIRPLRTYVKADGFVAWEAMQTRRYAYKADFDPSRADAKPYCSILAYPVLTDGEVIASLGAVSIDSEIAHHFDGKVSSLEIRLVPYLALLELVLRYRRKLGIWGD